MFKVFHPIKYVVSKMKNRLALLGILLVAGLLMAGMGIVLGAGNLLKFAEKRVSVEAVNDHLKIYEERKTKNGPKIHSFNHRLFF